MRAVLAILAIIVAIPRPGYARSGRADAAPMQAAALATATLQIDGMDCAACTVAIRVALKKLSGVRDAKVVYEEKRATVEYEPAKVTPQQLVEAVIRLGYKASLVAQKS